MVRRKEALEGEIERILGVVRGASGEGDMPEEGEGEMRIDLLGIEW